MWRKTIVVFFAAVLGFGSIEVTTAAAQSVVVGPAPRPCSNKQVPVCETTCETHREPQCHRTCRTETKCVPFVALGRIKARRTVDKLRRYHN